MLVFINFRKSIFIPQNIIKNRILKKLIKHLIFSFQKNGVNKKIKRTYLNKRSFI